MQESHSQVDPFDAALLDYHLGHLDEGERARVEQRIQSDPGFAGQHEALSAVFRALRASPAPAPAPDLAARIRQRVSAAPSLSLRPRSLRQLIERHQQPGLLRLYSFRDVAAVAAVIVLMVGVGVPGLLHMRERGERIACSMNLAQLGRGLQSYAMSSNGALPFVGWSSNASWQPSHEPQVVTIHNRRHLYPLLSGSYVMPSWFVCPSTRDIPMPDAEIARHSDFLESRNISYASQNMAGQRPSLHDFPDLPVVSDDNPLFDDGLPMLDYAARQLGLRDPAGMNSVAHQRAGQNILTLRGDVKWSTSPIVGLDGDNIWTLQGVQHYRGHEGPLSASDSHLLK